MTPGTVLDGKYEILSRIGAGGMGEVFKARHLHLDALRCIKVMKQGLLADDSFRLRFLREARLATQIHHPNIAVVHDFFVGEGGNYMVTEFIDGTTLRQWSARYGPFPLAIAADVAVQVLAGLDHIHRRNLLHRDISPDNVMLSYDSDDRMIAKIIDLGVAKDTASADRTMAGVLIGNPKYMSPEQLGMMGEDEQLDGRTDLYSLGVVLFEMLLGVPPFASETPQGFIMKHLTQPPPRFSAANADFSDVPEALETIILRMLEKDRNRRFRDARELSAALEPFLSAPAGTLSRADVHRLQRGNEKTVVVELPKQPNADEDFERAWEDGRAIAWQEFIDTHPDSPRAEEARALLEEAMAFEQAGSETDVRQFLVLYPGGRHHFEAGIRLNALREPRDFDSAWEAGTTEAWDRYLAEHASSPRAAEARQCRQEAADYEQATATNTPAMWRAFLKTWPEGRHTMDAAVRLRK